MLSPPRGPLRGTSKQPLPSFPHACCCSGVLLEMGAVGVEFLIHSHKLSQHVDQLRIRINGRLSKKYVKHMFLCMFQNLPWLKPKQAEAYGHEDTIVSFFLYLFGVYHGLTLMNNFRSAQWCSSLCQGCY